MVRVAVARTCLRCSLRSARGYRPEANDGDDLWHACPGTACASATPTSAGPARRGARTGGRPEQVACVTQRKEPQARGVPTATEGAEASTANAPRGHPLPWRRCAADVPGTCPKSGGPG